MKLAYSSAVIGVLLQCRRLGLLFRTEGIDSSEVDSNLKSTLAPGRCLRALNLGECFAVQTIYLDAGAPLLVVEPALCDFSDFIMVLLL